MRNWLTFAAGSTILFAVAAFVITKAYRTPIPLLDVQPDQQYMPGNPVPPGSYRDWQYAISYTQYCVARQIPGENVTFDVSRRKNLITHTSVTSGKLTVGDLMLAWGQPTGYARNGFVFEVYWGTRSAYVVAKALSPYSPVVFVAYDLELQYQLPWQGLINRR
jgi:hypothetical protein